MASGKSRKSSKRPSSGSPSSSSPFASKKKRPMTPLIADDVDSPSSSPASFTTSSDLNTGNSTIVFKDPNFEHSGAANTKRKGWKNLKQILTIERGLPWKQDDPTYGSIDAPPAFKPAKKYSDLSGFPAKYKDPRTGIRYSDASEFSTIRNLPSDIVTGYLAIRKAAPL
ncbi:INO80 complex subunit C [Exaiptasia diaphana]|uniref:Vps72/YL1 C-terminal domain-containing protein n=1 Tax=Exaiptasia diaphana TaxID=2652724 RepID=A0A913X4K3_EXADI|nr:INO80 complex subunit C [Exaiptasia diaphana]KXJ15272.1 INO80 complex subunit C [Exaiptasia diaphana]